MHSDNTIYNICAEITSWKYYSRLSALGEPAEGSGSQIHIEAVNGDCEVLQKDLPLWLRIIDNRTSINSTIPLPQWELGFVLSIEDPALPAHLQAELPVSEVTMRDMKDCLFLAANSTGSAMQIQLTVQEKENTPDSIAERTFSINEFSYELIHRRIEV